MQRTIQILKQSNNLLVLGHVNPDGDTIGSGLALTLGLKALGKSAVFAIDGEVPEKLLFLLGREKVCQFYDYPRHRYDCVVAVDVSDPARLGRFSQVFEDADSTLVIDHHMSNRGFAMHSMVRECGASGQIVLELLEAMGVQLSSQMADLLFSALYTDTGMFTYQNTDESLLHAAARLRAAGADIQTITEEIYKRRSFGATRLIGRAIERLTLYEGGKIALTYVERGDYQELDAKQEDTDELVNYAREIRGVEVAILLKEAGKNEFKVSLRSMDYVNVAELAGEFSGGGHIHAAGCTLSGTAEECKKRILAAAKKYLK